MRAQYWPCDMNLMIPSRASTTRVVTVEAGEYIGELCCLGESNW